MYIEVTPRQYSIRVYEKEGDVDYIASAQLFSYGDRCCIYSINGRGFYGAWPLFLEEAHKLNIKSIEGYVSIAHARLLRRLMRDYDEWEFSLDGAGIMYGHELVWVKLKYVK